MAASEAGEIHRRLPSHHDGKAGYVIFRCVYGNDDLWARFVARLNAHVNTTLHDPDVEDGELLQDCWTFDVREDESELSNVSKEKVCQIFNEWAVSVGGDASTTKYNCCIYADDEVVDSVISGYDPMTKDGPDAGYHTPFVKLIDYKLAGASIRHPGEPEEEYEEYREDDGEEPIEGCASFDVGWQKVSVRVLMPRAYCSLMNGGWESYYTRPQQVHEN